MTKNRNNYSTTLVEESHEEIERKQTKRKRNKNAETLENIGA